MRTVQPFGRWIGGVAAAPLSVPLLLWLATYEYTCNSPRYCIWYINIIMYWLICSSRLASESAKMSISSLLSNKTDVYQIATSQYRRPHPHRKVTRDTGSKSTQARNTTSLMKYSHAKWRHGCEKRLTVEHISHTSVIKWSNNLHIIKRVNRWVFLLLGKMSLGG